jgi:hypothetical protein
MKTTPIQIGKAKPEQRVIDVCEKLLERAKSGELRSIVFGGTLTDGKFTTGFDTADAVEAVGLLTMAIHNLAAHSREISD